MTVMLLLFSTRQSTYKFCHKTSSTEQLLMTSIATYEKHVFVMYICWWNWWKQPFSSLNIWSMIV